MIGEPQRAFYGNQYSLMMPVFAHYGVELWVPEVGGPIDPDSEAHDLIMSVFGGLSKGERNRIKLRVRAAMSAQAALEGRFLGGRPPYGYRLIDAGPHPNPAKAADGKRLHKLEPDPGTAWVVRRIFAEYLAGRGLFAIAEGLTRDQIPSPSQHDRARNRHRTGEGWSKSAVRVILTNPRYTGRQVWNKQRKDEILLDVDDVAAGYETRMRWNEAGRWVWSDTIAHEPLISAEDFQAAQAIMADAGRARRGSREAHQRVTHPYVLRGRLYCGYCGRRMQGQYSNQAPYYRCRYPKEYALASHVRHPGNVYLREADVLPAIDRWLAVIFAPHRLEQTIREMQAAQDPCPAVLVAARAGHPGPHRRLRRPARPLPGRPRRRSRPQSRRRVDPPGQGRARRRARPRRQPRPPQACPPAHRGRHPCPHHRPRRPARRHPRRRASRESSHLRTARAQGHLPARTRQNPGRRDDQPGDIRRSTGEIWGNGSCPRGDLNPHALYGH